MAPTEQESGRVGPAPHERDLSLEHLQAECARLHVLLQREVRRWQLAGQDPGDVLRGLYVSDVQADALLARPFGVSWGQTVDLDPAEAAALAEAEAAARRRAEALVKLAEATGQVLRPQQLAASFGLSPFELDLFLICAQPEMDSRFEAIYG
jgi:hypothetical protein